MLQNDQTLLEKTVADQWKILQILQDMCFRSNIRIFRNADENLA